MRKILSCRRSVIAILGIISLTWLGLHHGVDISGIALAISGIVASVSGANAWENRGKKEQPSKEGDISP